MRRRESEERMKLNFWQWLVVAMLVLVTPLWIYNKVTDRKTEQMSKPTITTTYEDEPTTEPTTEPTAAPATAPAP